LSVSDAGQDFLEVWSAGPSRLVPLVADQVTVGREVNDGVGLPEDDNVSRLHAVLQRYPTGWAIRDLGSTNGTYVNGQKIVGERALRAGDKIRVGRSRLVVRASPSEPSRRTVTERPPPNLTRRERDILVALCWPLLHGDAFAPPAPVRDIAESLHVSVGAVKTHLSNLYDKFELYETGRDRRGELAREAINRHAVDVGDITSDTTRPG
jgi:hypothetical protein